MVAVRSINFSKAVQALSGTNPGQIISLEMLAAALKIRFKGKVLESALDLIHKASNAAHGS